MAVRMVVSGVRSSWAALAVKRRWLARTRSRSVMPCWMRSSMPLTVPARVASSSAGVVTGIRSDRFSAERRWAVAEIVRMGRSTRPATSQPRTAASTVTTASAIAAWLMKSVRVTASIDGGSGGIPLGEGLSMMTDVRWPPFPRISRYVSVVSSAAAARTSAA